MKASEFVKEHGLVKAIEVVKNKPPMNSSRYRARDNKYSATISTGESVSTIELKRIIESHELVESKGGLIKAKEILADNLVWCSGSKRYSSPLERAIADVESCTEAGRRLEVKSEN